MSEQTAQPLLKLEEWAILLGGGIVDPAQLQEVLKRAPHLIAADGGGNTALSLGHVPRAVIGDMDSLTAESREALPEGHLFPIPEQDSTDFEKCLSRVEAPLFLGLGFTGARIDHELAVYHVLMKYPDRRCLIVGSEDVVVHIPDSLEMTLPMGTRVSLFPFGDVTGWSEGLRWPIEGLSFGPDKKVGTSNEMSGEILRLSFDGPGMLVILPVAHLWDLAEVLTRPGA